MKSFETNFKQNLDFNPVLCLVTDRTNRSREEFLTTLKATLEAGVTWVQLREKAGASDREIWELGLHVRALTQIYKVPLVVDDRLDLAMALDADGVHLGQTDLPLAQARRLWPEGRIWGVSVHTREQAEQALHEGATYLGVGALFPTASKADAVPAAHAGVRDLTALGLPLIGIGGLTAERLPSVQALGCAGVAAISAIWGAEDPAAEVRRFRAAWG